MRRHFIIPVFICLSVSACSHQEWSQPGAGVAKLGQDKLYCRQQASVMVPANNGLDVNWSSVGTIKSVDVDTRDHNLQARKGWFNDCMFSRGWQLVTVPNY